MLILGLNMFHGDASAALVQDGEVVFAVAEERLNRIKHYAGFPCLAIKACLDCCNTCCIVPASTGLERGLHKK